ncbi:hypothetical protein JL39_04340 [Rhizobium sp. YS-1r]|nr:hypothetical protein JL39_04340 [Rhizobium sp. YS-1r]
MRAIVIREGRDAEAARRVCQQHRLLRKQGAGRSAEPVREHPVAGLGDEGSIPLAVRSNHFLFHVETIAAAVLLNSTIHHI